jgi:hypothetical protein
LAGEVKRAPGWMRAVRIEWLFRLAMEPRRLWRRYVIGNATFLAYVIAYWATQRVGWLPRIRTGSIAGDGGGFPDLSPQRLEGHGEDRVGAAATAPNQLREALGASRAPTGHPD